MIEEPVLKVIGEKLESLTIHTNHAVVMPPANRVVETRTRRPRSLKTTPPASGDRVDDAPIRYGSTALYWPGTFITVDMTIEYEVHIMCVIQNRQRSNSEIANALLQSSAYVLKPVRSTIIEYSQCCVPDLHTAVRMISSLPPSVE